MIFMDTPWKAQVDSDSRVNDKYYIFTYTLFNF